jgi:hypothetical protein
MTVFGSLELLLLKSCLARFHAAFKNWVPKWERACRPEYKTFRAQRRLAQKIMHFGPVEAYQATLKMVVFT